MNHPTPGPPAGTTVRRSEAAPDEERTSALEHALQLRAFDGRMTVPERAAHIAVYLELARELDTRDAQSEGVSPDLCAWDATVIQAADACREVAVMLGQATVELAAVRNTVRRCLSAISSCGDICGPHKEATASCARRVDIARRGAKACADLISSI